MQKKKVIHVVWSVALGGIERVVFSLIEEQLKNGDFAPALLIAKHNGPLPEQYKNINFPVRIAGFKKGYSLSMSVIKTCNEMFAGADIIHIHSYNPVIAFLASRSGKKIVYTEHGNFAFSRKQSAGEKISSMLLKKFLNSKVDLITFNSKFSLSIAMKRYQLDNAEMEIVYNGTSPVPEFLKAWDSSGLIPGTLKIVTVSRLVQFKKTERLIRAFSKADNSSLQLIITGEGHQRMFLENLAAECGIKDRVLFTGALPSQPVMAIADLCVFPSQNEPFGLVAIEALQLGKPVVVFKDAGGLAEIIEGIEPELILENEEQLSKLLSSLQTSIKDLSGQQKIINRKTFANSFSIAVMSQQFNKLYNSL